MTIGEASEKTGLSADTLRYYEKIGLIPPVPRRENGLRDYGTETLKLLELIQRFKAIGMPLETIQAYLKLAMLGSSTREERRELLLETRENIMKKIDGLLACLRRADDQLARYDTAVTSETELAVSGWAARETRAGAAA